MKAVIFDFEGTLARRAGSWRHTLIDALDQVRPGHAITPEQVEPGLRAGFPWHEWERAHPELTDPDAWWEHLRPVLRRALEQAGVDEPFAEHASALFRSEYVRLDRWSLFPDTIEALERLRDDGWRLAILSNHCPELPDLVRGLGLWGYFDAVLTSAAISYEKPHPEAFARAVAELGQPDTVWMVGDGVEPDVAGPSRFGIPGILVRGDSPGLDCAPTLIDAVELIAGRSPGPGSGWSSAGAGGSATADGVRS